MLLPLPRYCTLCKRVVKQATCGLFNDIQKLHCHVMKYNYFIQSIQEQDERGTRQDTRRTDRQNGGITHNVIQNRSNMSHKDKSQNEQDL